MDFPCPRLLIAGTAGDSGKTVVSVGLARAWSRQGLPVAPFKKGPDYIDASWLSAAAGRVARNLDTYLSGTKAVRQAFFAHAVSDGVQVIEGNRGLHDGLDVEGSHSSAALSKIIQCPVILVQDVTKTTRSAAAFILGTKQIDPDVHLAGVVLNRVAGARHEKIVRSTIEKYCGIPVLGAIPKLSLDKGIPSRHLGLITAGEEARQANRTDSLAQVVEDYLDLPRLLQIARNAPDAAREVLENPASQVSRTGERVKIAVLSDSAFSFYYPENLEALEHAGADLIPVSALSARQLPTCDAVYVGGGFPETHAAALADNNSFRQSFLSAAVAGLPIYAECGGLIYLGESLAWKGKEYPMSGIFPVCFQVEQKPQGHGYACFQVDDENPFFEKGIEVWCHEFHYSRVDAGEMQSVFQVKRGTGCGGKRDGLLKYNVLGTYFHIHALGCKAWAEGLVRAAKKYRKD